MAYDRLEQNKEIFQDTMRLCQTNGRLKRAVAESRRKQYIIKEETEIIQTEIIQTKIKQNETINKGIKRYDTPARITVSQKRSLEAAGNKDYEGMKVCVHNFASATNPGGGVVKGAVAQEECICRCSTLYPDISTDAVQKEFYQEHKALLKQGKMDAAYNDDCIFTPGVVVFKTDDDYCQTMEETVWYSVDVITCAAPNLRERPSNSMNPDSGSRKIEITIRQLEELHKKRLRKILSIARKEGEEVMILGAFGCGAFRNPAWVVADAFHEVVQEFLYDFRVIEFAVYCKPQAIGNYEAFCKVFRKESK